MEFLHHKIIETVCAFRFNPSQNNWDITKFADYYNLIKEKGFIKKQEIKPFHLSFQLKSNELPKTPEMMEGEAQMVFKNEEENKAILLGNNYISFHTINFYPGWNIFLRNFVENLMLDYFNIGLGNGLLNSQMIYINNFNLEKSKQLSDYLTFVPKMKKFGQGDELSHLFQSSYEIAPNKRLQIKTILNASPQTNTKNVILECNCLANMLNDFNKKWDELATEAHDSSRNAFINISTDYFKKIIT